MKSLYKYRIVALLLLSIFWLSLTASQRSEDDIRLLVVIKIDGLNNDKLHTWNKSFHLSGFRKVLEKGVFFDGITHRSNATSGSSLAATCLTGTYPDYHGIVNNNYYDRQKSRVQSILHDEKSVGIGTSKTISAHALLTSTVTDELRLAFPQAKIHAVGVDAETAIVLGGHAANSVSWVEPKLKRWATTTYYNQGLNRWADAMNVDGSFKRDYSVNALVSELASTIINQEKLGSSNHPDALMLHYTLSEDKNNPYIKGSEEERYFDLDYNLQQLFHTIESSVGDDKVLYFIMTGCEDKHTPDQLLKNNIPGGYFQSDKAVALLNTYLIALYGHEKWVSGHVAGNIYLNKKRVEEKKIDWDEFTTTAAQFLSEFEGVYNAYPVNGLVTTNNITELATKINNAIYRGKSGDLVFVLQPGWLEVDKTGSILSGCSAPVPKINLYLMNSKLKNHNSKQVYQTIDIAPTISSLLNLPNPNGSIGTKPLLQ